MDRSFEQIRTEVLELDLESRRLLAEEIEHTLVENETEFDEEWRQGDQATGSMNEIDCGRSRFRKQKRNFLSVDNAMIEEAKQARKGG